MSIPSKARRSLGNRESDFGSPTLTISLDSLHRVHFVGIGGIGMSALARLLVARGHAVSGSDAQAGDQMILLEEQGVPVVEGHEAANIDGAQLLVVTSAINTDNPEVRAARAKNIPVVKRSELLGAIMNAGFGIAVAGTHGKTTTSALVGHILVEAGLDPTILVGGVSLNLGSNTRVGSATFVVAEADEYDASFLQLRPRAAAITNVEPEHLDFYGTVEHLHQAFREFANAVSDTLVVSFDDPALPALVGASSARIISFGLERGEYRAEHVREDGSETHFDLRVGEVKVEMTMALAGLHNVRNTLAATALAHALGVPLPLIAESVKSFKGVARRFEVKGEIGGVLLMDDYAHHPTEIRVNLAAIKQRFNRPVRLVFQPHTYSRTKAFLPEFASAFDEADHVYLLDIYAAREADALGVSGHDLAAAARSHPHVIFTATADQTAAKVLDEVEAGDVVVTMGAGDVYQILPRLLEGLKER